MTQPTTKRHCSTCKNNPTCWGRIELARSVQGFKYFAETAIEAENTGALGTTSGIYAAAAAACSRWEVDCA